jgi:hypothetical protein
MPDETQSDNAAPPAWMRNPKIIAVLVVFFIPAALYLIWKHPEWNTKKKQVWTGVSVALFAVMAFAYSQMEKAVLNTIVEADQLWQQDEQGDAVDKYRKLLKSDFSLIPEDERPRLFRRVIDFDAEGGDRDEARKMIALAKHHGVSVSLETSQAKALRDEMDEEEAIARASSRSESSDGGSSDGASKLAALQRIVDKLEDFPDRLAGRTERQKFTDELEAMIERFHEIPLDVAQSPDKAKAIVELFDEKIHGRYSGYAFIELDGYISEIVQDLLNR